MGLELADIFRQYGPAYRDKYADLGAADLTPQAYKLAMLAASQPP